MLPYDLPPIPAEPDPDRTFSLFAYGLPGQPLAAMTIVDADGDPVSDDDLAAMSVMAEGGGAVVIVGCLPGTLDDPDGAEQAREALAAATAQNIIERIAAYSAAVN